MLLGDPRFGQAEPLVVAMSCWSVCVRLRRRGARAVGENGGNVLLLRITLSVRCKVIKNNTSIVVFASQYYCGLYTCRHEEAYIHIGSIDVVMFRWEVMWWGR